VLAAALALTVALPSIALADQDDEAGLLAALARVPATDALDGLISYVDYGAVAAARPGALEPASVVEFLAGREADDPAADRLQGAMTGVSSGPSDLLSGLYAAGVSWPETLGFDFFDIDRAVAFGAPPSNGIALLGEFDAAAIEAAYERRGYTSAADRDHALLCSAAGCEAGLDVDPSQIDQSVPFGGRLGRQEPLALSESEVLSSPDIATLQHMLETTAATGTSLADLKAFQALASAPDDAQRIIQAMFLGGHLIFASPQLDETIDSVEDIDAALAELDGLAPLPAPETIAVFDGATATEQVVTIALAYQDEEAARQAADAVAARLESVSSVRFDGPLSDALETRGVTAITPSVREPAVGSGESAVGVVELRAPLVDDEPTPTGALKPSSLLYRLFYELIMARDLLWITPVTT
jgi:hypothetical protein